MKTKTLEELKNLYAETTPGSWKSTLDAVPYSTRQRSAFSDRGTDITGKDDADVVVGGLQDEQGGAVGIVRNEDARFIVAVYNAFPDLVKEIENLRAMIETQPEIFAPFPWRDYESQAQETEE